MRRHEENRPKARKQEEAKIRHKPKKTRMKYEKKREETGTRRQKIK